MVLVALLVAGYGLTVLGSRKQEPLPVGPPEIASEDDTIESPFVLTLSAPARKVTLETIGQSHEFDASSRTLSGTLPLKEGHPALFIDIEWAERDASPRFAKLVLEPAGFPTLTRVFDSSGDLSDVWEFHLHHDEHE